MTAIIIGVGNPGRGDDGLGAAAVEHLAGAVPGSLPEGAVVRTPFGAAAVWKYGLNIEDAHLIKDFDRAVFVDASIDAPPPFVRIPVEPSAAIAFTTHEMAPGSVLSLCEELYGRAPEAFLAAVRGYDWDLREGLSDAAARNLADALAEIRELAGP